MIEVEHLTKYYGATPVVRDVSFNVERGEILGFLGPNGAGKTTTMRMITGYLPPTSGTVRVAGFDVVDKSLEARRHLGYLPETVPLYTELTTFEYLDFRARITGLHSSRERRARIFEVMDLLNLGDVQSKLVGNLSRGYRQRVGLAQAMLHNPDVLILDEPTVGLDPVQITEVRALIKELGQNHTVILSTHLLPEVSMVCNRVIIINRGRLVALDTPINLAEGTAETHTVQVEATGPSPAVIRTLQGVAGVRSARLVTADAATDSRTEAASVSVPGANVYQVVVRPDVEARPALASALVGAGYQLLELHALRPSLEDIFIDVISQDTDQFDEAAEESVDDEDAEETPDDFEDAEVEDEAPAPVQERVIAKRRVRK